MGPRSDFSKPCQGAAEKSANATRKALHSAASKATVRLCLARGSQPVGMSNNRLRFTVRREDSNSNDDDRSQRLKQGGVVGAVLIFQSPAKGLQKNQQTQPVRPCAAGQAISPAGCCLARGSQPVGMSNKRPAVYPGEMELALFVFHPDAVQPVCDKGLPV